MQPWQRADIVYVSLAHEEMLTIFMWGCSP